MNKNEFKELFIKNVETAILMAENVFSAKIPRDIKIELYGCELSGAIISIEDSINIMFIDEDSFYRIIDIGVKATSKSEYRIFVRISPHPPSIFENTWNTPVGNGPFKVLEPLLSPRSSD